MKITTDLIVGTGLVAALLATICFGGGAGRQNTIALDLIGYLGRIAVSHG